MNVSTTPIMPSRKSEPTEALSPNGENLAFLCPDLSTFMDDLRAKVNAARAWPVSGQFPKGHYRQFNPFARLPTEIRQRVWEIAARQPRVLEVTCHDKPLCDTPVPAVLHASSESRKYGLKVYEELILDSVYTGSYVNWEIDTIFVNDRRSAWNRSLDYGILHEKCRKLALPNAPFSSFNLPPEYKNVDVLILVFTVMAGEGNVEFVPTLTDEEGMMRPRTDLSNLWSQNRIKSYQIRDVVRGRERTIVDLKEKRLSQKSREKERSTIAPLRSDEDVAIRLQYDLDHGLI